jgi:hypothetical protein
MIKHTTSISTNYLLDLENDPYLADWLFCGLLPEPKENSQEIAWSHLDNLTCGDEIL